MQGVTMTAMADLTAVAREGFLKRTWWAVPPDWLFASQTLDEFRLRLLTSAADDDDNIGDILAKECTYTGYGYVAVQQGTSAFSVINTGTVNVSVVPVSGFAWPLNTGAPQSVAALVITAVVASTEYPMLYYNYSPSVTISTNTYPRIVPGASGLEVAEK